MHGDRSVNVTVSAAEQKFRARKPLKKSMRESKENILWWLTVVYSIPLPLLHSLYLLLLKHALESPWLCSVRSFLVLLSLSGLCHQWTVTLNEHSLHYLWTRLLITVTDIHTDTCHLRSRILSWRRSLSLSSFFSFLFFFFLNSAAKLLVFVCILLHVRLTNDCKVDLANLPTNSKLEHTG